MTLDNILLWLKNNYIEVLGFITSLICVWLNIKANIWGWFWAIISSGISAIVFYKLQLFGDMNLQFFFIMTAIYGWYQWRYGKKDQKAEKLTITFLPHKLIPAVTLTTLGCFLIVFLCLKQLRGDFVWLDAITTTLSISATWLAARKYIENWIIWIVTNILYVGMYFEKNAELYSFLYLIFLVMAVKGFIDWKKKSLIEDKKFA
ncbi:MAG: nicotinamide riboside transporter PnuC [Raineya sp.]|nr:nicotinamide riboside transporter PnuC [Raineya sp.]